MADQNFLMNLDKLNARKDKARLDEILHLSKQDIDVVDILESGLDVVPEGTRESLLSEFNAVLEDAKALSLEYNETNDHHRRAAKAIVAKLERISNDPNLRESEIIETDTEGLGGGKKRVVLRCEGHADGSISTIGNVCVLVADGGKGKTKLVQQLFDAIARGDEASCGLSLCPGLAPETEVIDGKETPTKGHGALLVAAEDEGDELKDRAKQLALLDGHITNTAQDTASNSVPWSRRTNNPPTANVSKDVESGDIKFDFPKKLQYFLIKYRLLFGRPKGESKGIVGTDSWRQLWKKVAREKPIVVGIDSATITFGGDPNEKAEVLACIAEGSVKALQHNTALIYTLHTRKANRHNDSDPLDTSQVAGSAAWTDHARSVLTLSEVGDKLYEKLEAMGIAEAQGDLRLLGVSKCNYGMDGIVRLLKIVREDPENGRYAPVKFVPLESHTCVAVNEWCRYYHGRAIKRITDNTFLSPLVPLSSQTQNQTYTVDEPKDENSESNGDDKPKDKPSSDNEVGGEDNDV